VTESALVVALANARSARRPAGTRDRESHDALADAGAATASLAPFLDRPVKRGELAALRELQRAIAAVVDALIDGQPAPIEPLNRIAARHPAVPALEVGTGGTLRATLRFERPSAAASLTDAALRELADLDPRRLRRCARAECALVFYDRSRSGTQRWHAERPCGLRERQRRHRAHAASAGQVVGTRT
jgi:predicted RNA-binding Zn ribbon-like protein